jgi:hypothetical protein
MGVLIVDLQAKSESAQVLLRTGLGFAVHGGAEIIYAL